MRIANTGSCCSANSLDNQPRKSLMFTDESSLRVRATCRHADAPRVAGLLRILPSVAYVLTWLSAVAIRTPRAGLVRGLHVELLLEVRLSERFGQRQPVGLHGMTYRVGAIAGVQFIENAMHVVLHRING